MISRKVATTPITRISTDAFEPYTTLIPTVFAILLSNGQITKDFSGEGGKPKKKTIQSEDHKPIPAKLISTSLVERSNFDLPATS